MSNFDCWHRKIRHRKPRAQTHTHLATFDSARYCHVRSCIVYIYERETRVASVSCVRAYFLQEHIKYSSVSRKSVEMCVLNVKFSRSIAFVCVFVNDKNTFASLSTLCFI